MPLNNIKDRPIAVSAVLEIVGEIEVSEAAERLKVSRTTLSRGLNGRAGISVDMSRRLSDVLGAYAAFWLGMQMEYELWLASRKARPKILPFRWAA
jgi:antitoxin HigA-1